MIARMTSRVPGIRHSERSLNVWTGRDFVPAELSR